MIRTVGARAQKAGLSPGSVVHTGARRVERATVDQIVYHEEGAEERQDVRLEDAHAAAQTEGVTWINVTGLHDTDLIERIGELFGLHPLTLEDIASVGQRPKVEAYDDYLYVVLRMLSLDDDGALENEQISLVLGRGFVLTFQERPGDVLEPVRTRIRQGKGRIRKLGADYLAYALIDILVDSYFTVLEHYSDRVVELEETIFAAPTPAEMSTLIRLKQELLFLRKAVWPVRELLAGLQREESELLSPAVAAFLRDAYDHAVQAIDAVETLRDLLSGLQDAYLSSLSFRMNEVMKVLTVMASLFIPLTFLVGVYGMNFDWMPELHWRWSYPLLWLLMLTTSVLMLLYFRRKRWI